VCVDAVKRICAEYQIMVSELWTYTTSFDQVRFNMVHRAPDAPVVRVPAAKPAPKPAPVKAKPAVATLRQAQGRPEQGRGTKAKPAAKAKPVVTAKAKAKPAAKKPAAKAKPKTKAKSKPAKKGRR
jgi:hypothetical protein